MIDCFNYIDLDELSKVKDETCINFHQTTYFWLLETAVLYRPYSGDKHIDTKLNEHVWIESTRLFDLERHRHKIGTMYLLCKSIWIETYERLVKCVIGICIQIGRHEFKVNVLEKDYTTDKYVHMKTRIIECINEAVLCKKIQKM